MRFKLFQINLQKNELTLLVHISGLFVVLFFLYLCTNYFFIRTLSINEAKNELQNYASVIADDLEFTNGKWNTSKYLSDMTIPSLSIYIYSIDGFMVDRIDQINGFLDTSNYDYASSFKTPKTISYISNETWRLYSHEIVRDGQAKGVIFLAYFDPRSIPENELDQALLFNAQLIDRNIKIVNNRLETSNVPQKEVDPNISFEVIDQYNKVYITNGGPPAYIDKSYLQDVLLIKKFTTITDRITGEKFIVYIKPIQSSGNSVGVVVIGKGLGTMDKILRNQIFLSTGAGILAIIFFAEVVFLVYKHDIAKIVQQKISVASKSEIVIVEKIQFDKSTSSIIINKHLNIEIPKDTYQFNICNLMFKNPNKRFDNFDFEDAIGERDEQKNIKRLVYDAVDAINEKVEKVINQKLIFHKNKEYVLNPDLASKIT